MSIKDQPSREQILASSAGWVAVVLNLIPGLGSGYLYQRRWRAYWVTSAAATLWFAFGSSLLAVGDPFDPMADQQNQLAALIGLLVIAAISAAEAGLAVQRARSSE